MFEHDKSFVNEIIKRPEIYIISKIAINLAGSCKIELQPNIMNYRPDAEFVISSIECNKIDSIVLEINENDHVSYSKEKSEVRSELLKMFKNRIINISVSRTASKDTMDQIIKTKTEEIKQLIDELIAQYSLDSISHEEFIRLRSEDVV